MSKHASVGVLAIILGTAMADSANILPSILLFGFGAIVLIGSKICGTFVL